jgi:hypothetical protein
MAASAEPKLQKTVFYSWQSDLPNSTNRGLILDALERAAKTIRSDGSVEVEPVVDRDTQNVPGAPDIAHTILQKIEKASAFVADVSIINPGVGRPSPNPNVLIELGYALRALGNPRTVLVANTANGPVESLPFDLRTKRVLSYHLPSGAEDKPDQRKKLQEGLESALRAIFVQAPLPQFPISPSTADQAVESIEKKASDQNRCCVKVVKEIAERVQELTPKLVRENGNEWDDALVEAIGQTRPLVEDFARVADAAAAQDSRVAVLGLFKGFAPLFTQYTLEPGTYGGFNEVQFDLPKFVGHELMVTLFSALIGEGRWKIVADLCREPIIIPNATRRFSNESSVTYLYASEHIKLLEYRNDRLKLNRVSLHADLLKGRHEAGRLGEFSHWRNFQDADVFLYLRSAFEQPQLDLWRIWRPWSAKILERCPNFLLEAVYLEKAKLLLEPLGVQNVQVFKCGLKERVSGLHQLFGSRNPFYNPFEGLNPDLIGTK